MNSTSSYRQAITNNKLLSKIVVVLTVSTILLGITVATVFPLKSKEYIIYEFSSSSNTFVRISKADESMSRNTALTRTLLRAYVKERETINHTDDTQRFSAVMQKSSPTVANNFKALLETLNYDAQIKRAITINSDNPLAGFENKIHRIDFTTTDTDLKTKKITTQKWQATLRYQFSEQNVLVSEMDFNPLGLQIINYAISERTE